MTEEGKLYVGNLSYETEEDTLQKTFEKFGAVEDVVIIKDRDNDRSKGFGFVTFQQSKDATDAIKALDETELDGRNIRVNKAKPRSEGGGGGGGGGGSRNYRSSGNSYDRGNSSYGGQGQSRSGSGSGYGGRRNNNYNY